MNAYFCNATQANRAGQCCDCHYGAARIPPPTTERISVRPRMSVLRTALMICVPVVALFTLCSLLWENPCPVKTGDRVIGQGGAGAVLMIYHVGGMTSQCKAGVKWDSGETEAVEGWRLDVISEGQQG